MCSNIIDSYYEDLGVVEDMLTSSIIEAFSRQVSVDPGRAPGYLECLKEIGSLRGGDDKDAIDRAVQEAYADGNIYTEADVANAYKYFGLSSDDPRLTEDSIIGKFYAYLSSTTQETETRKQLWTIGDSRKSERIKSAAEDSRHSYLHFLPPFQLANSRNRSRNPRTSAGFPRR
jgi:ubiquitin carboxyl-terminal hydrolase 25/28